MLNTQLNTFLVSRYRRHKSMIWILKCFWRVFITMASADLIQMPNFRSFAKRKSLPVVKRSDRAHSKRSSRLKKSKLQQKTSKFIFQHKNMDNEKVKILYFNSNYELVISQKPGKLRCRHLEVCIWIARRAKYKKIKYFLILSCIKA